MTALMTWLVPTPGPVRDHLLGTINRLAAGYDAPRFQPHITLTATVDAAANSAGRTLRSMVAGAPPVDVRFTAVGHEPVYFRSLYLLPEPSAQLMSLHQAAQRTWTADPGWPFMPHLSLLYSDIPEEQKHPIIDTINILLPLIVRFDAIELWARRDLEVAGWYRVAREALPGPPPATC
jgi:2'-5' RNA ligase